MVLCGVRYSPCVCCYQTRERAIMKMAKFNVSRLSASSCATRCPVLLSCMLVSAYAMSGTVISCCGIRLRVWFAMPGTDLARVCYEPARLLCRVQYWLCSARILASTATRLSAAVLRVKFDMRLLSDRSKSGSRTSGLTTVTWLVNSPKSNTPKRTFLVHILLYGKQSPGTPLVVRKVSFPGRHFAGYGPTPICVPGSACM